MADTYYKTAVVDHKRANDVHIRLTDDEVKEVEEYQKYLSDTLGMRHNFSDAFRAMAKRGHSDFKRERADKRRRVT